MMAPQPTTRRGQPLAALGLVLLGWVGARTALYAAAPTVIEQPVAAIADPAPAKPRPAARALEPKRRQAEPHYGPRVRPAAPAPAPSLAPPQPQATPTTEPAAAPSAVSPRVAAGHQLLFLAGTAAMPLPDDAVAAGTPIAQASPALPYLPTSRAEAQRWSADGWLLWRQGGNGFNLPGAGLPGASLPSGAYGSSQAGLVLRYRLAPASPLRPTLYLRASSGLYYPRGEELAAGLALRPLKTVPVALMAEGRVTRTVGGGHVVRPAVALVTELPPARLPFGLRAETYAQAGWVGGPDDTPFVDGQARLDRPLVKAGRSELRLGAGAWGGAQRGARRLDVGPSATLELPVGPVTTRLSADYRFRVAGNAAPGSGVAVTFSAGF